MISIRRGVEGFAGGILIAFFGLFLAYMVIFMDEQGILIDSITTASVPSSELAFVIFFVFLLIGLFYILLSAVRD